jgi:hypothetical protein
MIIKDTDTKKALNKFETAGITAEKQMSHYLKRAFEDNEDILVINDLRLEKNSEVAQIDHLIVHEYGFIIVESKSVTQKIVVNKFKEWKRIYNNSEKGMASPIEQGDRQMKFLMKYLQEHSDLLLRSSLLHKIAGQVKFNQFQTHILVAISDQGIIEREIDLDNVLKADAIPNKIEQIYSDSKRKSNNPLGKIVYEFHKETVTKIAKFLKRSHVKKTQKIPYETNSMENLQSVREPTPKYQSAQNAKTEKYYCSKCNSENLELLYGKYGYYFKCKDCHKNTSIKLSHVSPECKVRIRKDKNNFYKVCSSCNTEELYFTN